MKTQILTACELIGGLATVARINNGGYVEMSEEL